MDATLKKYLIKILCLQLPITCCLSHTYLRVIVNRKSKINLNLLNRTLSDACDELRPLWSWSQKREDHSTASPRRGVVAASGKMTYKEIHIFPKSPLTSQSFI